MELFGANKKVVFCKEDSSAEKQLSQLREIEPLLNEEGKKLIRQDIKCLEYGIIGENNISYELKNSDIPMYVLRDVYLEHEDLSAQIDYIIFTKKLCFVIECKNLYGDIEINNRGEFIRTMNFGGRKKKEGIYSPITQNQRHLQLMKKIRVSDKKNILTKFMADRYFGDFYKSIVVLANTKGIANMRFAKKEVKEQVIRLDQLIKHIEKLYKESKEIAVSDKKILSLVNFYLSFHKDVEKDYTKKYDKYMINAIDEVSASIEEKSNVDINNIPLEETEIFKELREYRLNKSREESIKPYFIYNNSQLKDLITKMPRDKKDLQSVSGFGDVKVNKYGDDILNIIKKY